MEQCQKDTVLLVVDDDADVRECLADVLSDEGYPVRTASNGREALELLCKSIEGSWVVVLDLMMPIMNGFQLLDALSRNQQLASIPVVVVSASHSVADPRITHLRKPVSLHALLALVESRGRPVEASETA